MPDHESALQTEVVAYLRAALPSDATLWATLNERKVSKRLGAKLNRMGRRAGVSDLMVLHAGRLLCIELKTELDVLRQTQRGYASPAQKQFAEDIRRAGGLYAVCRGVDDVAGFLAQNAVPINDRAGNLALAAKGAVPTLRRVKHD